MRIIKLSAIDSTNSYLRRLNTAEPLEDSTIVMADYQTNGRGQMGTVWDSQDSKNLMFSVFKDVSFVPIDYSFYISIAVSLSLLRALEGLNIRKLKVKWPNDILSDKSKIAGILIENVIKQHQVQGSIIGIGLNVNQTEFINLANASSLRLISGSVFDIDEVLHLIIKQIEIHFRLLKQKKYEFLKETYEHHLFRKLKPSTFRANNGKLFAGYIMGISNSGSLRVKIEDEIIKEFDLKGISLLY